MVIISYSDYLCDQLKYRKRAPQLVHGNDSDCQKMVEAMQASLAGTTDAIDGITAPQDFSLSQFLEKLLIKNQPNIDHKHQNRIYGGIVTACSFISNSFKAFSQLLEAKGINPKDIMTHIDSLQNFVSEASKLPMRVFKSLNDFLKYGNPTIMDAFSGFSDAASFQLNNIELDEQNRMGINSEGLDRFIDGFKNAYRSAIDFDTVKDFSGCLANYLDIGTARENLVKLITKLYAVAQLTAKKQ